MKNQILIMKPGECKFNLPLKLRKSFQVNDTEDKLQMQNLGFAAMPEQFKDLNLEPGKYFWGYANVEKVDMQGDLFPIETLEELAPGLTKAPYNKIFISHNYDDIASGLIVASAVDSKGLLILAKLNEDHQRSWEIWQSILNGSLDGLSMGGSFLEVESHYDEEYDMTITVAKKATATEVSLTSIPVNGESMLMGAFQKAQKKYVEKFGDPKLFAKGQEVKKGVKFKYKKRQDNSMAKKKELTDAQKTIFDKAIADGKSNKEANDLALKNVEADQVDEAEENVNQDLVGKNKSPGKEKKSAKKIKKSGKKMKKSKEPVAVIKKASKNVDLKLKYAKALKKIEKLEKTVKSFKKAKTKKTVKTTETPVRKSKKQAGKPVANTSDSKPKSGTPFLDWMQG